MNTNQNYITDDETTSFFQDATLEQKYAMVSFLLYVHQLDKTYKYSEAEIKQINTIAVTSGFNLGVSKSTDAIAYFQKEGLRTVLDNLRSLDDKMKTCYMLVGDSIYPSTKKTNSGDIKPTFGGYLFGLLAMPFEEYTQRIKAEE